MTEALVKRAKDVEETLMDHSSLERFRSGIGELERFLTAEKLARVALTAVLQNADLLKCDPRTILAATLQLGQVGLLPDGFLGQAYLIPYENTVNNQKVFQASAMIGYRGYGELIARSGKANSHDAQVVYANDVFDFAMGSDPYIRHVRKLGNRGEPIGAYAIVWMKEGPPRFEIMDIEELTKIRSNSRGGNSKYSPWVTWTTEMYRKSPVRRLAKYVPLSPEFTRASTIDEGGELGYTKFDDKTGEYVVENKPAQEERQPVSQPKRTASGPVVAQEKQVCKVCNTPVRVEGDKVIHVEKRDYDHKAQLREHVTEAVAESNSETPDYAATSKYGPPVEGSEIVAQDGEHEVRRWTDNNEIACAHKECKRCNELAAPFMEKPKADDSPSTAPAAEAPAQQQTAVTSAAQGQTAEGGLFDKAEPATKELTYDMSQTQVAPDPYHKEHNPQGKHISDSQHGRLWAILHSAQKKAEAEGKKAMTDDEFMAHVKAKGYADARYIPKTPKSVYDDICTVAGGEALKVNNGK